MTEHAADDLDDCWVVATIWAVKAVAPFLTDLPTIREFRAAAGDPDDGRTDGGNLDEVMAGLNGIWPALPVREYRSSSSVGLDEMIAGQAASVGVLSSKLPARLRYGFLGAHQIGVAWNGQGYVVMNPLAPNGSAPEPATLGEITAAARALYEGEIRAAIMPTRAVAMEALVRETIKELRFGGTLVIPAGARVTGYAVAADGFGIDLSRPKIWEPSPDASAAPYDALYYSSVLRGDPFLRVTAGHFANHYVSTSLVTETENSMPAGFVTEAEYERVVAKLREAKTRAIQIQANAESIENL